MIADQDRRGDRRVAAQGLGFLSTGRVLRKPEAELRAAAIHVLAAEAHRREAQQARQVDGRLGARHEVGFDLAVAKPEDLDAAGIVAPVPLPVDRPVGAEALSERGRAFPPGVLGHQPHRTKLRPAALVFQPNRPPVGREHHRVAVERHVHRAAERVAPGHPALVVREPIGAAPAVAVELQDLFDEVPGPRDGAVGLQRVNLRAERGEVDAISANHRRAEDRLAARDSLDHGPGLPVEHVVRAGRGAEVQIAAGHRGGRDVVYVDAAALGGHAPDRLQRVGVEAERHAGAVHDVHPAAGHHRRGKDGVGQRHRGDQPQRGGDAPVGHVAGVPAIEFQLEPVLTPPGNGSPDVGDGRQRKPNDHGGKRDSRSPRHRMLLYPWESARVSTGC